MSPEFLDANDRSKKDVVPLLELIKIYATYAHYKIVQVRRFPGGKRRREIRKRTVSRLYSRYVMSPREIYIRRRVPSGEC